MERHLFATAFTPNGVVTYADTIVKDYEKVFVLNGGPGTGKTEVLDFISKEALKRGMYVEIFHDPLIPERIEHIFIPELNTALITSNEINNKKFEGTQIYMDNYQNAYLVGKNREEIKVDAEMFYDLLNKGLKTIASAKALHDQLETYFIPNMDFDKLNKLSKKLIDKIEKYEQDYLSEK